MHGGVLVLLRYIHQLRLQILLKYLKLKKILLFSYEIKQNQPLTSRLLSKVLYNRMTTTMLSWTVFKPSIFSFPFLPYLIYFKYVFNNWCVQHQDIT